MSSRFLLVITLLFATGLSSAQSSLLNAKAPGDIDELKKEGEKLDGSKPLPYGHVDKRDIMWSTIVWEKIDLNQKVNYPLLYPLDSNRLGSDRKSLFQTLIDAIELGSDSLSTDSNKISEVYATSYFQQKKNITEIKNSLKAIFLPDVALDLLGQYGITGTDNVQLFLDRALEGTLSDHSEYSSELITQMEPYVIPTEITGADITAFLIKGIWYFDKRDGALKYRLLGIAPAGYDIQTQNPTYSGDPKVIPYFWVWFKDARNALHNSQVVNQDNSAQPLTFDHLLNSRRFEAVIYKTQNIYEDREIENYIQDNALMQLLESKRIREKIRNFELDMWTY